MTGPRIQKQKAQDVNRVKKKIISNVFTLYKKQTQRTRQIIIILHYVIHLKYQSKGLQSVRASSIGPGIPSAGYPSARHLPFSQSYLKLANQRNLIYIYGHSPDYPVKLVVSIKICLLMYSSFNICLCLCVIRFHQKKIINITYIVSCLNLLNP